MEVVVVGLGVEIVEAQSTVGAGNQTEAAVGTGVCCGRGLMSRGGCRCWLGVVVNNDADGCGPVSREVDGRSMDMKAEKVRIKLADGDGDWKWRLEIEFGLAGGRLRWYW